MTPNEFKNAAQAACTAAGIALVPVVDEKESLETYAAASPLALIYLPGYTDNESQGTSQLVARMAFLKKTELSDDSAAHFQTATEMRVLGKQVLASMFETAQQAPLCTWLSRRNVNALVCSGYEVRFSLIFNDDGCE